MMILVMLKFSLVPFNSFWGFGSTILSWFSFS